jgi:Sulfotransferase domain
MRLGRKSLQRSGGLLAARTRDAVRRRFAAVDRRGDIALLASTLRPTDVFLVGHPRSGNTWLAYMLAILLQRGDVDGHVTVANIGRFVPVTHERDASVADHGDLADPRIFRNERPQHPDLYPRTVFIVRDPRAVLVSYFHYYATLARHPDLDLDTFVGRYLADGCIASFEPRVIRWDVQAADWLRRARSRPVLIVRYEDLHADRAALLPRIARFCDLPDHGAPMVSAIERGAYERMRSEEAQHGVEPQHPPDPPARGWFFRQGRMDGWRDELPDTSARAIEREFADVMRMLGYASTP